MKNQRNYHRVLLLLPSVSDNCLNFVWIFVIAALIFRVVSLDDSCLETLSHYKGLPNSAEELFRFCDAFQKGVACVDMFVEEHLGLADKQFYEQRLAPARILMSQLCSNKSTLQDEYLRHASCYEQLSYDWSICASPIKSLIEEEENNTGAFVKDSHHYLQQICLAKQEFLNCTISAAEQKCNASAVNVIRILAENLINSSQGSSKCLLEISAEDSLQNSVISASSSHSTLTVSWNFSLVMQSVITIFTVLVFTQ